MLVKLSFVFLNFFIAASFFSPTLRGVFLCLGLALWLLSYFRLDQERIAPIHKQLITGLNIFYLVFLLVNFFLKSFYEADMMQAIKNLFGIYGQWFWILFLLLYFSPNNRESKFFQDAFRTLARTTIAAATIMSVIVILQFLHICPLLGEHLGILSQPFTSSGLLLCSIFLTFNLFENAGRRKMRVVIIGFLQIIAILLLGQISAWFGLLISLVIYFWFSKIFNKRQTLILFLIPCCLLGLAYNLSPRIERKLERLSSLTNLFENKSMQCRFEIWKVNYQLWLERPIFGLEKIIPYNCQSESLNKKDNAVEVKSKKLTHAHNIYLQNLFHGGLVRFIAWLVFYLAIGFYLLTNFSRGSLTFFCSYIALSLEGVFENWWGDSEVLTLFFVMVLMFYSRDKSHIQN